MNLIISIFNNKCKINAFMKVIVIFQLMIYHIFTLDCCGIVNDRKNIYKIGNILSSADLI